MFSIIDAINKTPSPCVCVYIENLSLVKSIKDYVSNVTKKDVTYSDKIYDFVTGSVEINYEQKFTDTKYCRRR